MKQAVESHWHRAIERVVAHLQQVVERNAPLPDLDALAAIAHFSPWHFHRVYRALTGETVGRTVARLRLLRALRLLADSDAPVTRIAMEVGYETPQALARALRSAIDASASELRAQPALLRQHQLALAQPPAGEGADAPPLQLRIETVAPFEVVTLRRRGAFEELDAGFGELFGWAAQNDLLDDASLLLGVPLDDHRESPPQALEFDCAMAFSRQVQPPAPFALRTLGGGAHAVLRHVGPYELLEDALDRLLDALAGSGHTLREAPVYYLFLDDPEQVPAAMLRADLHVPVAPARG